MRWAALAAPRSLQGARKIYPGEAFVYLGAKVRMAVHEYLSGEMFFGG